MLLVRVSGQPFDEFDAFVDRRRRACQPWLLVALLGPLVVTVPLAYAQAADPAWIAGVDDAGDEDDSIALLTDTRTPVEDPGR